MIWHNLQILQLHVIFFTLLVLYAGSLKVHAVFSITVSPWSTLSNKLG